MTFLTVKRSLRIYNHAPYRLFTSNSHAPQRSHIRTAIYSTAFALSAGIFAVYYFDARSALHRWLLTPILRNTLDAETSHKVALRVLGSKWLAPKDPLADERRLKAKIWGLELSNPVGLAAGLDKDGEAVDGLFDLGFSWVEIGSVTPKPQPGNARPRVFRLEEDSAVINRYGFPSQGHASVLSRLRARIPTFSSAENATFRDGALLAVNLGKNKESPVDSIDDFLTGVQTFGPYADVLVINVSSPNTPGLRGLQNKNILEKLLEGVTKARDDLEPSPLTSKKPKIILKIAPDLDEPQLIEIAEVIRDSKIDGVIVSNTTIQRPKGLINDNKIEAGGLSGPPVKHFSLKVLKILRTQLPASIPLIGCGGITSGKDVLDYAKAGASMVQLYTGFAYDGVGTCRRIKDQLAEQLEKEGKTWEQVVDDAVQKLSWKEPQRQGLTVQQLVEEAQELNAMLDKLADKFQIP